MIPLIVSGLGRCGSSLVMQMLSAGGMRCAGGYPSFEDRRATLALPGNTDWLNQFEAVKVLDPSRFLPPHLRPLRIVWLSRNTKQQARSYVKLLKACNHPMVADEDAGKLRKYFDMENRSQVFYCKKLADERGVLRLSFESILKHPEIAAELLQDHAGRTLDVAAMAAEVKDRKSECLPGLLEPELVAKRAALG